MKNRYEKGKRAVTKQSETRSQKRLGASGLRPVLSVQTDYCQNLKAHFLNMVRLKLPFGLKAEAAASVAAVVRDRALPSTPEPDLRPAGPACLRQPIPAGQACGRRSRVNPAPPERLQPISRPPLLQTRASAISFLQWRNRILLLEMAPLPLLSRVTDHVGPEHCQRLQTAHPRHRSAATASATGV